MVRHAGPKRPRNLLRNPSFEKGRGLPSGWEWLVVSGPPAWEFAEGRTGPGSRSVRILQDGRGAHAEFRQAVPCAGGRRYRLQGWIRAEVDGTGSQSGANLYVRSLAGGKQVHDMWFRPFLVGLSDWTLWSEEYVAPASADTLMVSFDMRHSCGVAWFDDLALSAIPEPLVGNRPLGCPVAVAQGPAPVRAATVVSNNPEHPLAGEILAPLLGAASVEIRAPGGLSPSTLAALCERRLAVIAPSDFAAVFRGSVRCAMHEDAKQAPCARIVCAGPLTRGFAPGDVIPWWRRASDGEAFAQEQVVARPGVLDRLGFDAIATGANGRPVILHRPVRAGGILVMDVGMFDTRPTFSGEENLPALILTNALGRPQTSTGRFVHPGHPLFDYDGFRETLRDAASTTPSLRLREEGQTREGRPIYSLSVGREDAPAFYVDCGIHSDEWAPCYGAVLYAIRLAKAWDAGEPWARALLSDLRLLCIPLLSPDGWDIHRRFIRELDLNRNFPLHWQEYSGGYKGPGPLSEPESRVVAEIFRREKVVAAANWHETTAGTNWVGFPRTDGRYRKYAVSVPSIFRQVIDGRARDPEALRGLRGRAFLRQAATWTQITDPRNFHWQRTDSYPYVRDYGPQRVPYELLYADSLGIDGLTVEQYGNSDLSSAASPQRTEMTAQIIEMLFGLQIGLVCRNASSETMRLDVPIVAGTSRGSLAVHDAAGRCERTARLTPKGGVARVRAELPPGGTLVAELDVPPWKQDRSR